MFSACERRSGSGLRIASARVPPVEPRYVFPATQVGRGLTCVQWADVAGGTIWVTGLNTATRPRMIAMTTSSPLQVGGGKALTRRASSAKVRSSRLWDYAVFLVLCLFAAIEICRRIKNEFSSSYRPELHYMRGPGPKTREKHGDCAA